MSPTLRSRPVYQRALTSDSAPSTSPSSVAHSPSDTPRQSPSSTSLSSLGSLDDAASLKESRGVLLDTYGNEFEIPNFTIKQIRDAIPAHCFKRSGLRGLAYVFRDAALIAATFYIFHNYVTPDTVPRIEVRTALWALYTFMQGCFGTGLWVLAHECGHQAFSSSKTFNDTVGWIVHSSLLVPYFSWKISHGKHHKATGNMERDMVFVPKTRTEYATRIGKAVHELTELTEETPIYTALHFIGQQLGGWPMYLMANVTGHNYHERQSEGKGRGKRNGFFGGVNHFDPKSPLYERKDEHLILLSDLGLGITVTVLTLLVRTYGWSNMLVWYFIPYLWVNHWLGKCSTDSHSSSSATAVD
jgi:omega-6 fatty acid desaturase / acyl-lipid omega-6 desaturase (Delta-12 desaturase)